jgi:phosphoserine phosphatase RsbU/P
MNGSELKFNNTSVLVVDDNPQNLQVLGGLLQRENMDVEFALDGKAALSWLDKKIFDLILLDIMMPGMDGYEVCKTIKNNPLHNEVPVIFITAKTDTESIIKGFETGGVDYITKPFIPNELLARVKSQVNIKKSKEEILTYLKEIEISNKNIKDSIEYARNIQKTVLKTSLAKIGDFPEYFILYLPKDIVSGDFYWYYRSDDSFILAVMDCTGHGVPGAFMSILGITLLNEIVVHKGIQKTDEILENLRSEIKYSLGQNQDKMRVKDGMDGAIINYNTKTGILGYSGAFNPLLLIHNSELIKIDPDRFPIGYYEKETRFSRREIKIEKNDIVYMFSDGYVDQFGGTEKRKIMYPAFKNLLLKIHELPLADQKTELQNYLNNWKKELEQTDDILVVGIRF